MYEKTFEFELCENLDYEPRGEYVLVVEGNVVCIDSGDEDAELSIFDAAGCCVHRSIGAAASVRLDNGVYLLRLRSAKGSVVRRFVVR